MLAAGLGESGDVHIQALAGGLGIDPAPQSGPTPPPHETGSFEAYGVTRRFDRDDFWHDDADGLLFLFHLHGFAPLARYAAGPRTAQGDEFWQTVVADWLAREATPRRPAWHPYPTSLRIVAWAAALSAMDGWPDALRSHIGRSLLRQGRYLSRSVEHDVGGNHVLKNATALAFAGALLPRSGLLDRGLRLLAREVPEQVLADGGHIERSPSYQRQVTADLGEVAELLRRTGRAVPAWLADALTRAAEWQAAVAGPDGRLPLLGDAWEGPPVSRRSDEEVTVLAQTGLHVLRTGADQAVLDVGALPPPYLPPHAHAHALSFVLWLDGAPLIVDPGSGSYTGPWRDAFRSTAFHNTVELDGADQCELWGDFRAAFLPKVTALQPRREGDVIVSKASHDGYRRLRDPVEHERAFVWWPGFGLAIVDTLRAKSAHAVASRLHLAPGLRPDTTLAAGRFQLAALGDGPAPRVAAGWYSAALGRREEIAVLEDRREVMPDQPFGWAVMHAGGSAVLDGDRLALTRADGAERTLLARSLSSCRP
ncbi:MAG: hypothetical protein QOI98_507 [Solirubrobacteraceae bacterium]|nr:hypothetical protein [Solirubrobacteraceae bacterium]